jgi:hypothetical protein
LKTGLTDSQIINLAGVFIAYAAIKIIVKNMSFSALIETQRAIIAEIEAEQTLVAANGELIHRMEAKVKAAIDRVWGTSSDNSG